MEYEIDEVRKISIGGVGQKIHIRGEKRTNPVLLFLHGGPGISNRDSVVNREKDLCDVFTIVAWDQRGTGGSYWGVKKETLNLEQLISDPTPNCGMNSSCATCTPAPTARIAGHACTAQAAAPPTPCTPPAISTVCMNMAAKCSASALNVP